MDDPIAVSRQRTVDDVASLAARAGAGGFAKVERVRRGQGFEVNRYFEVLPHLYMERDYVLDFAYYPNLVPHIYARKTDEPRCPRPEQVRGRGRERTEAEHWLAFSHGAFGYHHHIHVDDTEEGFFQLVLLVIMGAQFYLWWHANYNDWAVVCTHAALEALVSAGSLSPHWICERARDFDLAPSVKMSEDEVVVSVALFTAWAGLHRRWFSIRREFPHQILDSRIRTLVEYDCGLVF